MGAITRYWIKVNIQTIFALFITFGALVATAPSYAASTDRPYLTEGPFLLPQLGSTTAVQEVAFSADGANLVTMGGVTIVWDVDRSVELARTKELSSIAFTRDGQRVFGINDGKPAVWHWQAGAIATPFTSKRSIHKLAVCEERGLLVGVAESSLVVWSLRNSKEPMEGPEQPGRFKAFAASSDCSTVLTGDTAGNVINWDVGTAVPIGKWSSPRGIMSMTLSASGQRLAIGHNAGEISFWTLVPAWRHNFVGFSEEGKGLESLILAMAFSADERRVLTGSNGGTATIWDFNSARSLGTFRDQSADGKDFVPRFKSVSFSPVNPAVFATAGYGKYAIVWDAGNGAERTRLAARVSYVRTLHATPDFQKMIAASWDGSAYVWDLISGRIVQRLRGTKEMIAAAISADGKHALTGGSDKQASYWDVATGIRLNSITTRGYVESVALLSDGETAFLGHYDEALLWKPLSKVSPVIFRDMHGPIPGLSVTANGKLGLTSSVAATLWDLDSGKKLRTFSSLRPDGVTIGPSVIAPSGQFIINSDVTEFGPTLVLMDVKTGERTSTIFNRAELPRFNPNDPSEIGLGLAISPDETRAFTGTKDGTGRIWSLSDSKMEMSWPAHSGEIYAAFYSNNGRYIVTGGSDGTTRIWRSKDGSLIATLMTLIDGTSIVFSSDGRFDSPQPDSLTGINWAMPDALGRPLAPEIFMRDYFEPRLLGRLLECDIAIEQHPEACRSAFPSVRPLVSLNRIQPTVTKPAAAFEFSSGEALVTVGTEQAWDASQKNGKTGTAPYDLRLFRNGQLVGQWPEPNAGSSGPQDIEAWRKASLVPMRPGQTKAEHTFRVALPSRDRGKPVVFTAYAFNEDRVKSKTAKNDEFKVPEDMPLRKARAYVISVGVNTYDNSSRNLSFAAKDARDLSAALSRIKGYEVVPLTLVSDDAQGGAMATRQATKANIRAVFELLAGKSETERARLKRVPDINKKAIDQLRKATPDDLVIIAFSGHGYTEPSGQFYLLPSDSGTDSAFTPAVLSKFISSEDLSEWLREVDAGQMAMIIDACHSAASVDAPGFKPGPMGDRGLGQLAYDKGMMILAATQADDVALEVNKIEQGLLTYALVHEGLNYRGATREADLNKNGTITLKEWLQYGEKRVPGLYEDVKMDKVQAVRRNLRVDSISLNDTVRRAQTPSLFDFNRNSASLAEIE